MRHYVFGSVLGVFALGLAACSDIGSNTYQTSQVQQVTQVQMGKIISETQVQVSGGSDGNWVGTVAGGAAGGIAGSTFGEGSGSALMAVGGAVLGGLAGNYAEKKITTQEATRYVIQLNNGSTVAVVQKDSTPIPVGTKVQIVGGNPAQVVVDNTSVTTAKSS